MAASDFIETVGVNIHDPYSDTSYLLHGSTSALERHIQALGVKWVRTGLKKHPYEYEAPFFRRLTEMRVRVLAGLGAPRDPWGGLRLGESSLLASTLRSPTYAGRIAELEMPNESDLNGGGKWSTDLEEYIGEYIPAIRALLGSEYPIVGPSFGHFNARARMSRFWVSGTYVNLHPYTHRTPPERALLQPCANGKCEAAAVSTGTVVTEFGWTTTRSVSFGVTEAMQATYLPRALLWNFTRGVKRTFLYELFDQRPDARELNSELHFGLVRTVGDPADRNTWTLQPKPAYTVLKHLLTRLRTPPRSAGGQLPAIEIIGDTASVQVVVLQVSSDSVDVALWLDAVPTTSASKAVSLATNSPSSFESFNLYSASRRVLGTKRTVVELSVSPEVQLIRVQTA